MPPLLRVLRDMLVPILHRPGETNPRVRRKQGPLSLPGAARFAAGASAVVALSRSINVELPPGELAATAERVEHGARYEPKVERDPGLRRLVLGGPVRADGARKVLDNLAVFA